MVMTIGNCVETRATLGADLVEAFARVSGDFNPIHIDPNYARGTAFGRCIAHGMLVASFISGLIGNKMPGPGTIYLSQSLSFRAPVYVGESVVVRVTCVRIRADKPIAGLATVVTKDDGTLVIEGEAVVKFPPSNV